MYLSRLILNPMSREARRDLADCQALHQRIMYAFPDLGTPVGDARARNGVLHRVETQPRSGQVALLVQSLMAPDWSRLPPRYLLDTGGDPVNPVVKPLEGAYKALVSGDTLIFRLRANPTRKVDTKSGPDGQQRNGRRVPLRGEDAWVSWLTKKGETHGFQVLSVRASASGAPPVPDARASREAPLTGWRRAGREEGAVSRLTIAPILFEGRLRVTDAAAFQQALAEGIGPAKAYGCGLLSVARMEAET